MSAAPARAPARRTHPPKGTYTPAATCSSTRGPPSSCSTPIDLPFLAVEQQQHQLLLLEQLHAEKSGRRRRGRARRREQVSRRQRARTSRSRGSARPAIYRASEQRAAARDSNSVTRKTYHVPKPATFHTHTDHTLLLTPTDYNIYHIFIYPTASAGFQASAAHSASAGQHLSPTQQLHYAPIAIPATKS